VDCLIDLIIYDLVKFHIDQQQLRLVFHRILVYLFENCSSACLTGTPQMQQGNGMLCPPEGVSHLMSSSWVLER
jgi:hypothetical protein